MYGFLRECTVYGCACSCECGSNWQLSRRIFFFSVWPRLCKNFPLYIWFILVTRPVIQVFFFSSSSTASRTCSEEESDVLCVYVRMCNNVLTYVWGERVVRFGLCCFCITTTSRRLVSWLHCMFFDAAKLISIVGHDGRRKQKKKLKNKIGAWCLRVHYMYVHVFGLAPYTVLDNGTSSVPYLRWILVTWIRWSSAHHYGEFFTIPSAQLEWEDV